LDEQARDVTSGGQEGSGVYMFKNILLAVGGPDASLAPARAAGGLAANLGAQLTIVSVYRPTSPNLGDPFYSESLVPRIAEANATIDQAAEIAREMGVTTVDTDAIEGDPAERIATIAGKRGCDLIVMGTHRRGRIGAALLGSVSSSVAARAGVPVMVVPEPAEQR
jgi:nucleotide-binding universal stress UspA family protein